MYTLKTFALSGLHGEKKKKCNFCRNRPYLFIIGYFNRCVSFATMTFLIISTHNTTSGRPFASIRGMQKILLFIICLFICQTSLPAQVFRGVVTDIENQPIEGVRIFTAENPEQGVFTKTGGAFSIKLPEGSHTVIFQHLNFEKKTIDIVVPVPRNQPMHITLIPRDIQMGAVEIYSGKKDPAYAIVKEVIAHKKFYLQAVETYRCETYQKLTLESQYQLSKKELKRALADTLQQDSLKTDSLQLDTVSQTIVPTDSLIADSLLADSTNIPEEKEKKSSVPDTTRKTLNLIESQATIYFQYPGKYKTVVNAYRSHRTGGSVSGANLETEVGDGMDQYVATDARNIYLFYQDVSEADFNFYQNLISSPKLGDRPFISPFNSIAWNLTYRYKLEERFYVDGRVNYRISFEPINRIGPYFSGEFVIEDDTWAIKSVDMEVMPTGLNFFQNLRIRHTYTRLLNRYWLIEEEQYDYEIKDGRTTYFGQSTAIHSEYELNPELKKNFFRNELRVTKKEAFEQDSASWENIRPMSLSAGEKNFTHVQDSIYVHHHSEDYLFKQDSIYNHLKFLDFIVHGITFRDRPRNLQYYFSPLLEQVQPFGVGGYRHSLGFSVRKTWDRWTALGVSGNINYGFANRDYRGSGSVGLVYAPKRFGRAWIRGGKTYSIINQNETIFAFFSPGNFIDRKFIGVGNRIELFNGLYLTTAMDFSSRSAVDEQELAEWHKELFGEDDIPPEFDLFREFQLDFRLSYTPGQKYMMEPFRKLVIGTSKWPTFQIWYKKAMPGVFGSELNFDFLELSAKHEFRPGSMGISRWRIAGGRFLQADNIRFTDYKFFRGSDLYFFANPMRNFQLLGPTISTRNEYLSAHYLHDFEGALLDKIPLLKYAPLQTTGGASVLMIKDNNFFHSEVFYGLQVPLRIKQQRFKIGGYYVVAYSNYENALKGQFKFGLSFFNPVKNQWDY